MNDNIYTNCKTGDLIVIGSEGFGPQILKTLCNTEYNHSTIVVRLDCSKLPEIKIVKTGGTLFFLEIEKKIDTFNYILIEPGYTNHIVLKLELKNEYYNLEFESELKNILDSLCVYVKFKNNTVINLNKYSKKNNLFTPCKRLIHPVICSELVLGIYTKLLKIQKYDNKIMYLPHHFSTDSWDTYFIKSIIYKNIPNTYNYFFIYLIFFIIIIGILFIINPRYTLFLLLVLVFFIFLFSIFYNYNWRRYF